LTFRDANQVQKGVRRLLRDAVAGEGVAEVSEVALVLEAVLALVHDKGKISVERKTTFSKEK